MTINKNILMILCALGITIPSFELKAQNNDEGYMLYLNKVEGVNNPDDSVEELSPVISKDGKHMFFVRMGDKNNKGVDEDANNQDIWHSKNEGGTWSTPVNLGEPINNKYHNVVCGTNADGSVIYLSNTYYFDKKGELEKMGLGMSYSTRQSDGSWSQPTNINIKGLKKENVDTRSHFYFHRSDDGKVLVFSTKIVGKDDDGNGKEKLYVCFQGSKKDTYEKIVKLNEKVNKPEAKLTAPYFSDNGKMLYYTSIGSGNAELYVVEHVVTDPFDSAPENWEVAEVWGDPKPVYELYNISPNPMHHTGFDGYFVLHNENEPSKHYDDMGYFARSENGKPADIYQFYFRQYKNFNIEMVEELEDGSFKSINIPNTLKSPQFDQSIIPINNKYTFYRKNDNLPNNLAKGDKATVIDTKSNTYDFDINYNAPDNYELIAEKSQTKFQVTDDSFDGGDKNIKLVFKKLSTSNFMVSLNFDWDRYSIRGMEREIISQVAATLKKLEGVEVILSGHTDNTGDPDKKNNQLSTNRANTAMATLKSFGVKNEVKVLAFGESKPKEGSGDEEVKSEVNRRVELVIKKIPKELKGEIETLCNNILEIRKKYAKEDLNKEDCFKVVEYDETQSIIQK